MMAGSPPASPLSKRFYREVSVEAADDGFGVRLDGRPPRSPGGRPLVFPRAGLAELVAAEWRAQGDALAPAGMRATRLAHTALDVIPGARARVVEGVVNHGSADLLCYFAEAPESLVRRQERSWGPLLEWARATHDLAFDRARGVIHRPQPPETLRALAEHVESLDDFDLAGVAFSAALLGSAVLALALREGRLDAEGAMAASRVDEIFQEEVWGVDAEAASRVADMAADAVMVEAWFRALAEPAV